MLRFALMSMVVAFLFLLAPPAAAQTYPDVTDGTPFTPACNYMSMSGYLRFLCAQQNARYVSWHECGEWAKEQLRRQKLLVSPAP